MSLTEKVITVTLKNLETLGAKYKLTFPDGKEYTNIVEEVSVRKRTRTQVVEHKAYYNIYYPVVSAMDEGQFNTITVPEGIDPDGLRSALSSWTFANWGRGKGETSIEGRVIQVMRN